MISGAFRSMYITWNWYSQRLSAMETTNRPNDKVRPAGRELSGGEFHRVNSNRSFRTFERETVAGSE